MNAERPVVDLIGQNGNAFAILALCVRAARRARWTKQQIDDFLNEAKSGDYNTLLAVVEKYFEVV